MTSCMLCAVVWLILVRTQYFWDEKNSRTCRVNIQKTEWDYLYSLSFSTVFKTAKYCGTHCMCDVIAIPIGKCFCASVGGFSNGLGFNSKPKDHISLL